MRSKEQSKHITSEDGLVIYYWITKDHNHKKSTVLLHPASSMNHSSLQKLEGMLNAEGHPTIVLDPRGTGYSITPANADDFTLNKYSSDISKILAEEGIEKPILFGHSAGFMPLANYVAETGNSKLLIGTGASYSFRKTIGDEFGRKILFEIFDGPGRAVIEYSIATFMKLWPLKKDNQSQLYHKSELNVVMAIANRTYTGIHQNTVSGRAINKWDITEQLKRIRVPTVLVYGIQDSVISPNTARYIEEIIPNCKVEYVEGKLSLPVTRPEEVLRILKKYDK